MTLWKLVTEAGFQDMLIISDVGVFLAGVAVGSAVASFFMHRTPSNPPGYARLSTPAKMLLGLVWAMRYEWIVTAIAVYLLLWGDSPRETAWAIVCFLFLFVLQWPRAMLFEAWVQARKVIEESRP